MLNEAQPAFKPINERRKDQEMHSCTCLLGTENGGSNWAEIVLPEAMVHEVEALMAQEAPSKASVDVSKTPSDQTVEFQGQGFDKCEIPTISQLQTWRASSPYGAVNLYIGGSGSSMRKLGPHIIVCCADRTTGLEIHPYLGGTPSALFGYFLAV